MDLAILNNNSSIGSLMTKELLRRGYEVDLYAPHYTIQDNDYAFRINYEGVPEFQILVSRALFKLRCLTRHYSILLNLGRIPDIGLKGDTQIPYYQGPEINDPYLPLSKSDRCFISQLNLLDAVPDGVLLPRCVNIPLFKSVQRGKLPDDRIVVGHLWRRGNLTWDCANRVWKGTDRLLRSINLLLRKGYQVQLLDPLVSRTSMPSFLAGCHVFAEQFELGIYSIPAIESLLVGTPVVGHYKRRLAECPEAYQMLVSVRKDPKSIAEGILEARDARLGSTQAVEEYHSPRHTVDIFLDTMKRWNLKL